MIRRCESAAELGSRFVGQALDLLEVEQCLRERSPGHVIGENDVSLNLNYDATLNEDLVSHAITLGALISW